METVNCAGCGKRLVRYEPSGFPRYGNPVRKCPKCGRRYADPRYREIAVQGIPADALCVRSYGIMLLLGIFILYRGIHLSGMEQLGTAQNIQWLLPTALMLMGAVMTVGGIVEIIRILTGAKAKRFDRLRRESESRLQDRSYALLLHQLGYPVPDQYL